MVMATLRSVKRMAASILKCGMTKVWIDPERVDEAKKAITREDVRKLIKKGIIKKIKTLEEKNPEAKYKQMQKKKGRRRGPGSRKGARGAREGEKTEWLRRVRAQRRLIKILRDKGVLERSVYRRIYRLVKGGFFRSKKHLLSYLKEHELLKGDNK
jgi:large subunit ribosomal protein L19e